MTAATTHLVEAIYPRLLAGEPRGVLPGFSTRARVDSPLRGKQEPMEWALDESAWLAAHEARGVVLGSAATERRVAHELTLWVTVGDTERELPVLLVADSDEDQIRDLRVYHSTWPLTGGHVVRGPLRESDPSSRCPEPVASYEAALLAGDVDRIHALFEPDGYVREPAGSAYKHVGPAREDFYGPLRTAGGVRLTNVTCTDDGVSVFAEYLCDEWGGTRVPAQAGAAVWERSAAGKISALRIYDDVLRPKGLFG